MKIRIAACLLVVCSIVSCAPSSEDGGSRLFQERFKAAEQGDAYAQYFLGVMYDKGKGVPQDAVEAMKWFRKAAEQGHAKSQHSLGLMYADDEGVFQDDVEAYAWFAVAAANGLELAKDKLAMVKSRLNQDQLAVAQQRATQLFEKINTKKK
jgi:TPR repeat protein